MNKYKQHPAVELNEREIKEIIPSQKEDKMKTDATAEIYLQSAREALNAGNYAAAEADADKMIETDPQSYRAWFIKGAAAGWQTTGTKLR